MEKVKQPFSKKVENFWYYYKWHTLAGIFIIIVLSVMLSQCASRPNPDVSILVVTNSQAVGSDQAAGLKAAFEQQVSDFNKNGKREVQLDVIDLTGNNNLSMASAMKQKLMAQLTTPSDVLMLMDKKTLNSMVQNKVLDKISTALPGTKSDTPYAVKLNSLRLFKGSASGYGKGLYLAIRQYKGTFFDSSDNRGYYKENLQLLKKILAAPPFKE